MSWGIQLDTCIYVPRVSKNEIESKIKENEEIIISYEKQIMMYASSTPKDIIPDNDMTKDSGGVIFEIKNELDQIFEAYKESMCENVLLKIMLEEIDKVIEG